MVPRAPERVGIGALAQVLVPLVDPVGEVDDQAGSIGRGGLCIALLGQMRGNLPGIVLEFEALPKLRLLGHHDETLPGGRRQRAGETGDLGVERLGTGRHQQQQRHHGQFHPMRRYNSCEHVLPLLRPGRYGLAAGR